MTYDELLTHVFQLECKLFAKTESYCLIQRKGKNNNFTHDERIQIEEDVHYAFVRLIAQMTQNCKNLTKEDIVFCCLSKFGFNSLLVSNCIGSVSRQAVNQRKYRIKIKMQEAQCEQLFKIIFEN
jgi:ribosomal protein L24